MSWNIYEVSDAEWQTKRIIEFINLIILNFDFIQI